MCLEVLVGVIGDSTTDKENRIETDTETGAVVVGGRGNGTGLGSLGLRVAGLYLESKSANCDLKFSSAGGRVKTYVALQGADKERIKGLAGLVAVTDILESLGGILTSNVEKNLLAASINLLHQWLVNNVLP